MNTYATDNPVTSNAQREARRSIRRGKIPRGQKASQRDRVWLEHAAQAAEAWGEDGWAHRLRRCSDDWWTAVCTHCEYRSVVHGNSCCNLPNICPICSRVLSRRLVRQMHQELRQLGPVAGQRWRFVTLAMQPGPDLSSDVDAMLKIRSKLWKLLRKEYGARAMLGALELGRKEHPHLHCLVYCDYVPRVAIQKWFIEKTGGQCAPLTWFDIQDARKAGKVCGADKRGPWIREGKGLRRWKAVGGSWVVDVRAVTSRTREGCKSRASAVSTIGSSVAETVKYATARALKDLDDPDKARQAVRLAVVMRSRHRVEGYGICRGVVGRAMKRDDDGPDSAPERRPAQCPCCVVGTIIVARGILPYDQVRNSQPYRGDP